VSTAIDFDLPDHEGKAWRLADHLARGPVLLENKAVLRPKRRSGLQFAAADLG